MSPARNHLRRRLPLPAVVFVVALLVAACGAAIALGSNERSGRLGEALRVLAGKANPDGANDFACRPRAPHPRPVVLVHGTFNNMRQTWNTLSPQLAADGYCVFALNYGDTSHGVNPMKAVGPIATSAKELARFVEAVRGATGASTVDIVGYSQGGLVARQYLRFEDGARRVRSLVALAPSNRGTTSTSARIAERFKVSMWLVRNACPACAEQLRSSELIRKLNLGAMTFPGIHYTVISTVRDKVVQPWRDQQLPAGPQVKNVTLQETCERNDATHLSIPYDRVALGWVKHALDPARVPEPGC